LTSSGGNGILKGAFLLDLHLSKPYFKEEKKNQMPRVAKSFYGFSRRGFTLIELLIVIAIILILIAIALPNFLEAQVRARVTNAKGALRAIDTAFNSHLLDWGCVPADFNDDQELMIRCRARVVINGPCSLFPDRQFGTDGGLTFENVARGTFYANNMHCPLTTPIAYLPGDTTIDIFSDGTVPIGYDSRAGNGKIIYGAFWSAGPDRIAGDWYRGCTNCRDYNGDGCVEALPYAPTNGTKSRGELWGVVGDWNHGFGGCESAKFEYGLQRTY
jgi:prepilin-type N-terminal cleavage/methylation domain-containing protein